MVVNWWMGRRCEAAARPHLEPDRKTDRQEGEGEAMTRGWAGIKHWEEFTARQRAKQLNIPLLQVPVGATLS